MNKFMKMLKEVGLAWMFVIAQNIATICGFVYAICTKQVALALMFGVYECICLGVLITLIVTTIKQYKNKKEKRNGNS